MYNGNEIDIFQFHMTPLFSTKGGSIFYMNNIVPIISG